MEKRIKGFKNQHRPDCDGGMRNRSDIIVEIMRRVKKHTQVKEGELLSWTSLPQSEAAHESQGKYPT